MEIYLKLLCIAFVTVRAFEQEDGLRVDWGTPQTPSQQAERQAERQAAQQVTQQAAQDASDMLHGEHSRPVMFHVPVNVRGEPKIIPVHEGDVPSQLAAAFLARNNLPADLQSTIVEGIMKKFSMEIMRDQSTRGYTA